MVKVVQGHHALTHALHPVMVLQHHQVAPDALQDAQVDVQARVVAAAQALVGADVRKHVGADALQDAKVHVVPVVLQGAPENVQVHAVAVVLRVALVNVEVDVHQDVPVDVKQPVQGIVLMDVIHFAVGDVSIHVEGRANMFQQDRRVPVVREHVVPIVIVIVRWHVARAVCLVAYHHQNDLNSDKRTRSRVAIGKSQEYYLYRYKRLSVGM